MQPVVEVEEEPTLDFEMDHVPDKPKSNDRHAALHSSNYSSWVTPRHILELAREMLGGIDLDPASSAEANLIVKANRLFTEEDDGLIQDWKARTVWLNYPYGRGASKTWLKKLVHEYTEMNILDGALVLMPSRTGAGWWQLVAEYPVCFIRGRLTFGGLGGNSAPFDSAVAYLGPHEDRFIEVFRDVGDVWKRVNYGTEQLTTNGRHANS